MSEQIPVRTSSSEDYTITIGNGILEQAESYIYEQFGGKKLFILIDQNVHLKHGERIENTFSTRFESLVTVVIPDGETSKSMVQFTELADNILMEGVERGTPVLAIGGGVTGDLAGFVAASVMRGLPLIHMPTTLLAMVDSAIGGKTGINHSTGKNLIGAFYQPKAVFADVSYLETLPEEEWVNGLSEIIKYGMIKEPKLLDELSELITDGSFATPESWISVISKSAAIKVDIVNQDVKESGVREFLNFGHTFAHVIETCGEYTRYSHGEAVFAGMYGAVFVSEQLGGSIGTGLLDRFKPLYSIDLSPMISRRNKLTEMMLRDKKTKNRTIRLILLRNLGEPMVRSFEDTALVEESWSFILNTFTK